MNESMNEWIYVCIREGMGVCVKESVWIYICMDICR